VQHTPELSFTVSSRLTTNEGGKTKYKTNSPLARPEVIPDMIADPRIRLGQCLLVLELLGLFESLELLGLLGLLVSCGNHKSREQRCTFLRIVFRNSGVKGRITIFGARSHTTTHLRYRMRFKPAKIKKNYMHNHFPLAKRRVQSISQKHIPQYSTTTHESHM
jgi:hypothetical protein